MGEHQLPRLLSVPELSERLGLQPWRIYEMIAQDQIPSVRIGRRIYFAEPDVARWIEAGGTARGDHREGPQLTVDGKIVTKGRKASC